ncbi:MAG TPA: Kdo hydroxylase family protein [Myxococcaceae bacterium]|nr:Kdo hydroxylase family protein [Myxococcaceae bacterium]
MEDVIFDAGSGPAGEISRALERGQIVRWARCPFPLPPEDDLRALREVSQGLLKRKNLSYYPDADRLKGAKGDPAAAARVHGILREHSRRARAFLERELPALVPGWTVGTSSFRPLQERGRDLKAHASNELVHVDAGAYGATHGDRILRLFVNISPQEPRVWATRGTFAELYARHGERAGVAPPAHVSLREGPLDRARSGALGWLSRRGLPMARVLDSSPYDRAMRRFHNFMKDDPGFRDGKDGYQEVAFEPGSAWMVLTDTRSHACVSGQFALVDTFLIPLRNCQVPEVAPYHVLRGGPRPPGA